MFSTLVSRTPWRLFRHFSSRVSLALTLAVALTSCSTLGGLLKASPGQPSGYIERPELLGEWPEHAPFLQGIWFKDRETLYRTRERFKKICFRPTRIDFLARRGWWDELNSLDKEGYRKDVQDFAQHLDRVLREAVTNDPRKRFVLAEVPDAETVVYEFALTELVPTKTHINVLGTAAGAVLPGGGAVKVLAKGSVAVEVKAFDGANGDLLLTWMDREHDQASLFSFRDFSVYGHARKAAVAWAEALIEAWGTPGDHIVEDESPITLSPF